MGSIVSVCPLRLRGRRLPASDDPTPNPEQVVALARPIESNVTSLIRNVDDVFNVEVFAHTKSPQGVIQHLVKPRNGIPQHVSFYQG
ncbi:hypothetical protein N7449_002398 [Penicillium cf. viridicatum]|uniref:Uncharacterized protein n=1 Tax=Penicillium cf. viridicatum TaxID=2972119 RepID=A0A9W9MUY7_9EURO|nr:hypothetical protein N7449_002398 [Penicillium cf. viridicatum]